MWKTEVLREWEGEGRERRLDWTMDTHPILHAYDKSEGIPGFCTSI